MIKISATPFTKYQVELPKTGVLKQARTTKNGCLVNFNKLGNRAQKQLSFIEMRSCFRTIPSKCTQCTIGSVGMRLLNTRCGRRSRLAHPLGLFRSLPSPQLPTPSSPQLSAYAEKIPLVHLIFLISQTSRSAGNQFTLHYHNILVSTF